MRPCVCLVLACLFAGCAAAPRHPPTFELVPMDTGLLRRCVSPVLLPTDPVEAIVVLLDVLEVCRIAARAALQQ